MDLKTPSYALKWVPKTLLQFDSFKIWSGDTLIVQELTLEKYDDDAELFLWMVDVQPEAVIAKGTIVKKPDHHDFPTHRGENKLWIADTAIHSQPKQQTPLTIFHQCHPQPPTKG